MEAMEVDSHSASFSWVSSLFGERKSYDNHIMEMYNSTMGVGQPKLSHIQLFPIQNALIFATMPIASGNHQNSLHPAS